MKSIIIGAGIAGLVYAINMANKNNEICVIEKKYLDTNNEASGAGIQISPNGTKILRHIGVADKIIQNATKPKFIEMKYGKNGKNIMKIEIKKYAKKKWKEQYIHIHRQNIINTLINELKTIKPNAIKIGQKIKKYEITKNGAIAHLENGEKIKGNVIVGADGIQSTVRTQMHPKHKNIFTGYSAWRTQIHINKLGKNAPEKNACVWVGNGKHIATTRINNGEIVNFVGIVKQKKWKEKKWRIIGDKKNAIEDFQNWNETIQNILQQTNKIEKWALLECPKLNYWSEGNVIVVGDAAHAMIPTMAQGAVMAMEDGFILSEMLSEGKDIKTTLKKFEKIRKKRIEQLRKMTKQNIQLFHHGNRLVYVPLGIISRTIPNILYNRLDKIYGYDYFSRGNA